MKSLEEVLEGIEAFVKDMEDLGVDVTVAVAGDLKTLPRENRVMLLAVVKMELEDLEATHSERIQASLRAEEKAAEDLEASSS